MPNDTVNRPLLCFFCALCLRRDLLPRRQSGLCTAGICKIIPPVHATVPASKVTLSILSSASLVSPHLLCSQYDTLRCVCHRFSGVPMMRSCSSGLATSLWLVSPCRRWRPSALQRQKSRPRMLTSCNRSEWHCTEVVLPRPLMIMALLCVLCRLYTIRKYNALASKVENKLIGLPAGLPDHMAEVQPLCDTQSHCGALHTLRSFSRSLAHLHAEA